MDEHARHAERIGDATRMLSRRAAEAAERVLGHVVSALHGNVLDRVRHVLDGDAQEAVRDLFGRARDASLVGDFLCKFGEFRTDDLWTVLWLLALAVAVRGQLTWKRGLGVGFLLGTAVGVSLKTTLLLASFGVAVLAAASLTAK